MELDEAELLCYLAAHANGEANGRDPLTCDRMGAALWSEVHAYMFGSFKFVKVGDAIQQIAEAMHRKADPEPRHGTIDVTLAFLSVIVEKMYQGLMPTRSAKVLIMQTALLKRLGKLKEET